MVLKDKITKKMIGIRTKWIGILFLILSIIFCCVSAWLLYSLKMASNPITLLVVMTIIVIAITIIFIMITILNLLKKRLAIYIHNDELVIIKYKEKCIKFSDIKNIQYREYTLNNSIINLKFKFGKIIITLNNDKVIKIDDIKNVKNVCMELRQEILEEVSEN